MPLASLTSDTSRFDRMASVLTTSLQRPMSSAAVRGGMEEAAHLVADAMQRRFNRASGGDGTWPKLARSTVKKKSRRVLFPERILYFYGDLFKSLAPGNAGSIFEVLDDRVRYGTRDRTAHYHQSGTPRMPARPILVRPDNDVLKRCTAAVSAGIQKAIENACANN